METIFRKVAVTERLPDKRMDCFVFYKFNKTEYTKCVEFIPEEKSFFDYGNTEEETRVTYWLEEIELPSDEAIDKEFWWAKGFTYSYQEKMLMGRKGAKWLKDLLLGCSPNFRM